MMPLQRACGAESQAGNGLSNGPLRAQSNAATAGTVNSRGYDGILLKAYGKP